ncbi:MAG: PDZ domain-containing protein [Planctomycetes bacterium]|nr:PDZ domain-containing protein [Planctomycetota bacterium]
MNQAVAVTQNLVVGLLCLLLAAAGVSAEQNAETVEPQLNPAHEVAELRNAGMDLALKGDFDRSLQELRKVSGKTDDKDAAVDKAITILEGYLKRMAAADIQRQRELRYEIDRMRWGLLAQEYRGELNKKDFAKELRTSINEDLGDAYQDIGTAETFEDSSADLAATMKATSLDAIEKARKAVQQAVSLLTGMDNAYGKAFKSEATTLLERLGEAATVWKDVDPSTPQSRWQGALKIQQVEEKLADAVTDVEVMVARKPWKVALLHGRLAAEIAPDREAARKTDWYAKLLKAAKRHAAEAVADDEWNDALSAYAALKELEPGNAAYRDGVKLASRHVRVIRMYGSPKKSDDADNGDDEDAPAVAQEDWKEFVSGVDAKMVRTAISKLDGGYVAAVDYRDLAMGALESVRILAETPEVCETFPGLKDDAERQAFIAAIEKEQEDLQRKDRVDHVDLHMALNQVIYSAQETVKLPMEVLAVEFADGFLDELDQFSSMVWPSDVIDFNKATMGNFTGIGVQITKEQNKPLKVVTPLLGTPAFKAGIKAGDLIVKVDGTETKTYTVDKLVDRIMGPEGTTVVLTIKRRGVAEPFEVPVVREKVYVRTVKGWQRKPDGEWDYVLPDGRTGYVRVTQFTEQTHEHVVEAFKQLKSAGIDSVVLDLRANPGGLLRSATAVANEFLDTGRIVFTKGRQVPRREIEATSDGQFLYGDMVCLVDQHSASAAEILCGALKDWGRAIVVGQRSYGKGSVQNVIPVRGRDAFLKLTTNYYYLPRGRLLHRKPGATDWGVDPDVAVGLTPKQMRRWITLQRKTDLLQDFDPELLKADLERLYETDIQLNAAVLLLRMMDLHRDGMTTESVASEAVDAAGS